MARALVFDFDGLLLETEGPAYQAWTEAYRDHGHELPRDRWLTTVGGEKPTKAGAEGGGHIGRDSGWFDALGHLGALVGAGFDRDAVHARREARKTELIEVLDLMPGVRERVAEAKARGIKVGVASSSTVRWVGGRRVELDGPRGLRRGDLPRRRDAREAPRPISTSRPSCRLASSRKRRSRSRTPRTGSRPRRPPACAASPSRTS